MVFAYAKPHFQTEIHGKPTCAFTILAEVQNVVHAPYNGIGHRPVLGQTFGLCDFLRRPGLGWDYQRARLPCPSYPLFVGMFRNK